MFPIPSQTVRSTPTGKRFRVVLPLLFSLVVAISIAGCSAESGNAGEAAPTRATPSGTSQATPSLGGDLIAFERFAPGGDARDLYAVGPDGGEPSLLSSPGEYPHWSPDGSELAFLACLNPPHCTTAVALLERSTGVVHGLAMPDPTLHTACAIWAPSGIELACEGLSETDPTRNGVYTIGASDGKGLARITSNPDGDDYPLAYSPDGGQLLIDRLDPTRDAPANHALFVVPVSGGEPHRITPWGLTDDYASWSPDGETIVFGTNGSLYRVNPQGQGLEQIALKRSDGSSIANAFDVAFSPEGTRIVFSIGSPEPGIYTAHLDGSDVRQLTASPTEDHHANWGTTPGS